MEQVGIDISAPCTHESNSLDVYTAKHARSLRKVQEDKRSLCVVCGLLAMFRNRKWLFWDLPISVGKSTNIALWLLVMPADRRNKMLECWLATLNASSAIMLHALEQINAARIGVICQSASSKLSASGLHGYSASIQKIQGFFGKAIFATPPIVLAAGFFSMAASLVLFVFGHGVETSNLGDVSAQKLCQASGDFSWNKLESTYLPPARMKVTHLMSTRPNMQEAWERLKKIKGHFVWCVVFLQCSEIESDCFEIFQSQLGNPRTLPFECLSCLRIEETRCWNAD